MSAQQIVTLATGMVAGFVRLTAPQWTWSRLALALALGAFGLFWFRRFYGLLQPRRPNERCRLCGVDRNDLKLAEGMLLCAPCHKQWNQRQQAVESARQAARQWVPAYPGVYLPAVRSEPGACCDDGVGLRGG